MGDCNSAWFSLTSYFIDLLSVICVSFRRFMLRILAVGPVPKHIAIIMDGNRRFADRSGMERSKGHLVGYDRLISTLEHCLELGVQYVSVYAFSIDNFGRPRDEVNSLMSLMEEKLDHLVTKGSLLKDFGVRVQVLGDLSLLPVNVRAAAERAMSATREYRSVFLNLCVAYTSTEEIVHSIQELRDNILMITPCAQRPVNGQLQSKSGKQRAINGLKHDREVLTNGTFSLENGDIHLNDRASNLEIWGKQKADAALLLPALSSSFEVNRDVSGSESKNGAVLDESVQLKPIKLGNVDHTADLHSRLVTECLCADEIPSCRRLGEDGRTELRLLVQSITVKDIESHLYSAGCPPPELLIRTSGETRLSNFMLWQCSFSRLTFCKVLWPGFGLRHLAWIILDYQRSFPAMQKQWRLQEQILDTKNL